MGKTPASDWQFLRTQMSGNGLYLGYGPVVYTVVDSKWDKGARPGIKIRISIEKKMPLKILTTAR